MWENVFKVQSTSHTVLTVTSVVPGGLAEAASLWTEHNFLLPFHHLENLQPSMLAQGKHPHKRSNLPNSLFSLGQPWQVSRTKKKTEKREKGLQRVTYQRTNFTRNWWRWFPWRWVDFLATTPCLSPFILSGAFFRGSANPPAWVAVMLGKHATASSSLLGVSTSVEVPHWDIHGFFPFFSKPSGHVTPDIISMKLLTCYSQFVRARVFYLCHLSAVMGKKG